MAAPKAVLPGTQSRPHRMIANDRFDAAFFKRYYANPATRVATREDQARLAALKRLVTEQQSKKSTGPGDGFDVRATGICLFFLCFCFLYLRRLWRPRHVS